MMAVFLSDAENAVQFDPALQKALLKIARKISPYLSMIWIYKTLSDSRRIF